MILSVPVIVQAESIESLVQQGISAQESGYCVEAERIFRQVISLESDSTEDYKNLGFILLRQEHYEEAEGIYREALRLDPGDANIYTYQQTV